MQSVIGLAELNAMGVCPCRILFLGETEGIGCVCMQNFVGLAELKALGMCPC